MSTPNDDRHPSTLRDRLASDAVLAAVLDDLGIGETGKMADATATNIDSAVTSLHLLAELRMLRSDLLRHQERELALDRQKVELLRELAGRCSTATTGAGQHCIDAEIVVDAFGNDREVA